MQQQPADSAILAVGALAAYPWIAEFNEVTTAVSSVIAILVGGALLWHRLLLIRKLRRENKKDESKAD